MLRWNFTRVIHARGHQKPYSFARKLGFSRGISNRIATNKNDKISLRHLEILCLALNCTPHDFLEWNPPKVEYDTPTCALHVLKPDQKLSGEVLLSGVPLQQVEAFVKAMREGGWNPPSPKAK